MRNKTYNKGRLRLVRRPLPAAGARGKWKTVLSRILLLPALFLLAAMGHALFTVREIQVLGTVELAREEILAAAGLKTGGSMLLVREKQISDRLEALPLIKAAVVKKSLPSTITITVQERVAAAVILEGGALWTVDKEGVVLAYEEHIPVDLPVITGLPAEAIRPGNNLLAGRQGEALASFLSGLEAVPELAVAELNVADPREMIMYTVDGLEVLLGDGENMEEKLRLVRQVIPYLKASGSLRADVRTGDRLVAQ